GRRPVAVEADAVPLPERRPGPLDQQRVPGVVHQAQRVEVVEVDGGGHQQPVRDGGGGGGGGGRGFDGHSGAPGACGINAAYSDERHGPILSRRSAAARDPRRAVRSTPSQPRQWSGHAARTNESDTPWISASAGDCTVTGAPPRPVRWSAPTNGSP